VGLKEVVKCVKRNKYFLITAHTNLEGDALGAELAFCRILKKLGKSGTIVNEDELPGGYTFLPDTGKIKKYKPNLKGVRFDCFVVLDCSDLKRTGEVYRMSAANKTVLNIDHHISNEKFGDVNWVEPHCSSCCEMVYRLYKKLGLALDRNAAVFLYTGMLADTGSFRYSNTAASTHQTVAELLRYNLDVPQIYKKIYEDVPFADMQLLARILPRMKRQAGGRIIWFQVKKDMLKNKSFSFDLSEHILSFGRAVKGAEAVVLFKENLGVKDEIRVNFRSQGKVDVNKVAAYFGGGGHKTASGATIHGRLDKVRREVLAKIQEALNKI